MRDETTLPNQANLTRSNSWFGSISLSIMCIHVVIPLLIGGFLYATFRSQTLLMFKWFHFVGVDTFICEATEHVNENETLFSNV